MKALDAAGHPTPLAVKNAGYSAMVQYLAGSYAMPPTYPAACTNAGLPLLSAWELQSNAALGGTVRGRQDGQAAVAAARGFGQPQGTAIYAAVDFAPNSTQWVEVTGYANAWALVLRCSGFLAGIYGGFSTMEKVKPIVDRLWQTYAWSAGSIADSIALYQSHPVTVAGVTCDLDEVVATPGAWNLDGPVQLLSEDTMKWGLQQNAARTGYFVIRPTEHGFVKAGIPTATDLAALKALGAVTVNFAASTLATMPQVSFEAVLTTGFSG